MNQLKRSVKALILMFSLYLFGGILSFMPETQHTFLLRNISSFYYLILGIVLIIYFSNRIIDKMLRRYLTAIGVMIVLWFFLRVEKYTVFSESKFAVRQLWYAFYIPLLMIPQLSLFAAVSLGNVYGRKMPVICRASGIVTALLIITVLTNDLHQLVFGFKDSFENSLDDYSHEFFYWIIVIWTVFLFITTFTVLFRKCTLPFTRKYAFIPIVYILPFLFWSLLILLEKRPTVFGENFGEFPENTCFMMGGLWVLCICIGLIPSNTGYGKIFPQTALSVQITDADCKVKYRSNTAPYISKKQMMENSPILFDDNHLVFRKKIYGGYVFRSVDITELNRINRELEETANALFEEKELIRCDNELKHKQALIDAKSKLYDDIAVRVLPQSRIIEKITAEIKANPECFSTKMAEINVFAVYIKRISNLMLFSSENEFLTRRELQLAICESLRYINKSGIPAVASADETELSMSSAQVIKAYGLFEKFYEASLPSLKGITAVFDKNVLKLTFEGAAFAQVQNGDYSVENDDDISFVRIFLGKDGEGL